MLQNIQTKLQPILISNFQELENGQITFKYQYENISEIYSIIFEIHNDTDLDQIIENIKNRFYAV